MFGLGQKVLDKNFDPSLLPKKLWLIFMRIKQKKIEMADSKKLSFSEPPILKIFSRKFQGLVLGLVVLIDAKGIDVAQPRWSWECGIKAQKQPKNTKNAFFGLRRTDSWPYRLSHIYALCINQSYWSKDHPWNFRENILRIAVFENLNFLSRQSWFFCFIPMKIS